MWEDVYHIILSGKNSNVYEILHIVNLNFVLIVFFLSTEKIQEEIEQMIQWLSLSDEISCDFDLIFLNFSVCVCA